MSDWNNRLHEGLEAVLAQRDPRPRISSYHDMPYAIFRYAAEDEFAVRSEITRLRTRLEQKGKSVTIVSLADCLYQALKEHAPLERLADAERTVGVESTIQTVHEVLASYCPLVDLVAERMPAQPEPLRDLVFIVRVGALFGLYRTFSLLEQLKGRVHVPAVLFYPGELDGPAGLKAMGIVDAEHNYRPKIF